MQRKKNCMNHNYVAPSPENQHIALSKRRDQHLFTFSKNKTKQKKTERKRPGEKEELKWCKEM